MTKNIGKSLTALCLMPILLLSLASCDRKADASADEIVAKCLEAMGGIEANKKQTTRKMEGSITLMGTTGRFTVTQKAPNLKHTVSETPAFGVVHEGFDGKVLLTPVTRDKTMS